MLELRTKGVPLIVSANKLKEVLGVRAESIDGILSSLGVSPLFCDDGKRTVYSLPEILHKLTFREEAEKVVKQAQRDKVSFDALPFSEQAAAMVDPGRSRAPRQKFMRKFIAAGAAK